MVTATPESPPESKQSSRLPSEARQLWAFAWPAVALNSLQVLNNLLDRFFIGHLPQSALTAQSASMTLMFLMFSLAMSLSSGSTAIVSRAFGAGHHEECQEGARQSVRVSVVFGILLAVAGFLITPFLARFVLPQDESVAATEMVKYLAVYALGLPAIYAIQALAGCLRGIGDSKSPMVISGIQIGIHMLLNTFLIQPPHGNWPGAGLGLVGAAAALTISSWVSAIAYILYASKTPLGRLGKVSLPSWHWTTRILRLAIPTAGMSFLRVLSLTAFTIILKIAPQGGPAIAAMGMGFAIESIMFMPAFGLSMAATAMVGQSLGANQPDRAERIGWLAGHHGALVIMCMAIPIFLGSHQLSQVMIEAKPPVATSSQAEILEYQKKERTIDESSELIRWLCASEFLFGYAMILVGALQGAGDTMSPLWLTIISLWLIRVPAAWLFAVALKMGPTGAWASMSGTQAIQGFLAMGLFKRGRWKTATV